MIDVLIMIKEGHMKIIMHDQISLDGSVKNFVLNPGLYYEISNRYEPDITLIGSITAKTGVEESEEEIPKENKNDFKRPNRPDKNYWVIPDTRGRMKGLLHVYRRFKECRDVIIFISEKTPQEYIKYLNERDYRYYICGEDEVDFTRAFDILKKEFGVEKIITDSGGTLNSVLLNQGLIDKISLIISPELVGENSVNLFRSLKRSAKLKLINVENLDDKNVLFIYEVLNYE